MAAHGVFHDLIILAAAEQNADAGVFMRALAVAVERLKIEGELAQVLGASVITLKPAIRYQFKTGQRDWPET